MKYMMCSQLSASYIGQGQSGKRECKTLNQQFFKDDLEDQFLLELTECKAPELQKALKSSV